VFQFTGWEFYVRGTLQPAGGNDWGCLWALGEENSKMTQSTFIGTTFTSRGESVTSQDTKPTRRRSRKRKGLGIARRFTRPGEDALASLVWERRQSVITNPDGSVVFKMEGAEVPKGWSQLATDIVVSKYFRKAGLHGNNDCSESSVRQVVHRVAHTIREKRPEGTLHPAKMQRASRPS
jgi:hypothetical protein